MHKIVINCQTFAAFYLLQINSLCPKILPITFQGRSGSFLCFKRKSEGEYLHKLCVGKTLPPEHSHELERHVQHSHTHTLSHSHTYTCMHMPALAHVFNIFFTLTWSSYDNCLNSNPSEQTK